MTATPIQLARENKPGDKQQKSRMGFHSACVFHYCYRYSSATGLLFKFFIHERFQYGRLGSIHTFENFT